MRHCADGRADAAVCAGGDPRANHSRVRGEMERTRHLDSAPVRELAGSVTKTPFQRLDRAFTVWTMSTPAEYLAAAE